MTADIQAPAARQTAAPAIVWFRQDLRLADNPALTAAAETGQPVLPVYILDTTSTAWRPGGAGRWWLHHSLAALQADLRRRYGSGLLLLRGDPATLLAELAKQTGASAVFWNRCYEPAAIQRDTAIKAMLRQGGLTVETGNSALLHEPWTVQTQSKGWFRVYSPFWRACRAGPEPAAPQPAPTRLTPCTDAPASLRLDDLDLLPRQPDWAGGLRAAWQPGEAGAATRLADFLDAALPGYADGRDHPNRAVTSRLSPHLHFGEIGPRQIRQAVLLRAGQTGGATGSAEKFLAELGWREFSYHLLYHFPDLPERNFRADFDAFPWNDDGALLRCWQRGRTGYPLVDAGMRELWQTGWMHNRVRMIAASFLVKHLRQHWRHGADWFWDTLVDADLANNAASWQWVAGSGADAAPYFRIFNPVLQGEKFDPDGHYIRRWLPELAKLPDKFIHKPWAAPPDVLQQAGVSLGRSYPMPVVDHDRARRTALAAFSSLRNDTRQAAGE